MQKTHSRAAKRATRHHVTRTVAAPASYTTKSTPSCDGGASWVGMHVIVPPTCHFAKLQWARWCGVRFGGSKRACGDVVGAVNNSSVHPPIHHSRLHTTHVGRGGYFEAGDCGRGVTGLP
eukprot:TRINITY_DN393_c0_g1_i1.p2 TRINITY_DN393_c0_g1~~TRINITY_DN393_c0_g1_i1.p2  ORF type:complete len:120 (+),score=18.03 TRINITY_DN393_c0_g1_i1:193-552(+)